MTNGAPVFTGARRAIGGLAILFLIVAAFFGFLNAQKIKALRTNATNAEAARNAAERRLVQDKLNASTDETAGTEQQVKVAEAESRATKAEAELAQVQKEKVDLQAKLDAAQQEIASLQKQVEEAGKNADSAEKEKVFLAEKFQDVQQRASQPKEGKKRRETASAQQETVAAQREISSGHHAGVRGNVLAYNQAYNFVVLNLGARQGVEQNAEMLVLRDGTPIGKIRISSVEPATAIGDIISASLARGVQVQPGDTVIYAGTSP